MLPDQPAGTPPPQEPTDFERVIQQLDTQKQLEQEQVKHQETVGAVNGSGEKIVQTLQNNTKELTSSIHDLLLATLVSKDPKITQVAKNLSTLLDAITSATDNVKGANFQPLANQLKSLQDTLRNIPAQIEAAHKAGDPTPELERIAAILGAKEWSPNVNVKAPAVDLSKLEQVISDLRDTLKKNSAPVIDNSKVEKRLDKVNDAVMNVTKAINSLSFPSPNYVLPFKDSTGKATQVQLDASGNLPIASSGGGTQYAEGATTSPGTGTLSLGRYLSTPPSLTNGQVNALQLDSSGNLKVTGSLSVGGTTDNSAYTANTSTGTPSMGFYHSTIDPVTDGRAATIAITANRASHINLRNAAGTEVGTSTTPLVTSISNGTNMGDVVSGDSGQNSQVVVGARKEVSFTTTTAQSVASTDVSNYRWVSVQINSQGTSSTITFQGSNDNTNWVSFSLMLAGATGTSIPAVSTTAVSSYVGPLHFRYFRLTITGISAGTTAGVVEFMAAPSVLPPLYSAATELSLADNADAVVASSTANGLKTMSTVRLFDGTNYNRWQQSLNATNSVGTGIAAVGNLAQFDDVSPTAITENQFGNLRMSANRNLYGTIRDAAGNERGANVNASNQLSVSVDNSVTLAANQSVNIAQVGGSAVTSGNGTTAANTQRVTIASDSTGQVAPAANATSTGASIYNNTALSSTKQAVNASAGNLYGYHIYNSNSVVIYIQLFNVASAGVTVGTTPPTAVLAVPALGWVDSDLPVPISFGTALTIAATTTATGSTAPGTALLANLWYK